MTVPNVRRPYHAPRRAEQAAATRTAIISAAARLFAQQGYAATTMAAIAREAQVTAKSVYALAEKPKLLLLAVDWSIVGDTAPVPVIERPEVSALLEPGDARAKAAAAARYGAETLLRLYPVYRAFEQAAGTEPELREAWREYQLRRRTDVERIVRALSDDGALRPELTVADATDTLWALVGWHPVALLVEERGWDRTRITRWLEDVLVRLLVAD